MTARMAVTIISGGMNELLFVMAERFRSQIKAVVPGRECSIMIYRWPRLEIDQSTSIFTSRITLLSSVLIPTHLTIASIRFCSGV